MENSLNNINLDLVVQIIRSKIEYNDNSCLFENLSLALLLKKLGTECFLNSVPFYIPHSCSILLFCHPYINNISNITSAPSDNFHCWLEVYNKFLYISIGSINVNLPDEEDHIEYIYGDYHEGINLDQKPLQDILDCSPAERSYLYKSFSEDELLNIIPEVKY